MSKSFLRTFAACALLVPMGALASPITVNFTITATQSMTSSGVITPGGSYAGFASGTVGGGSFTFDDSLVQGSDLVNGLPTLDLAFTWLGQSFTEATATLWSLSFDSTGALSGWGLGRRGVDIASQGWNTITMQVTGMSSDGRLVFGQGEHNGALEDRKSVV